MPKYNLSHRYRLYKQTDRKAIKDFAQCYNSYNKQILAFAILLFIGVDIIDYSIVAAHCSLISKSFSEI